MRFSSAVLPVVSASLVLFAIPAQAQYRGGTGAYGSAGYGGYAYGGGANGGRAAAPSFVTPNTGSSSTDNGNQSSDYANVMKSVDGSTKQAFGAPKSDAQAEKEAASQAQAHGGGTAGQYATTQPSMNTLPNAQGGYNAQLGGNGNAYNANGAYGSNVTNGTAPFTSPSGTTGLGQYNSSPYASGRTSGTNAAQGNSPVAPAYTGQ